METAESLRSNELLFLGIRSGLDEIKLSVATVDVENRRSAILEKLLAVRNDLSRQHRDEDGKLSLDWARVFIYLDENLEQLADHLINRSTRTPLAAFPAINSDIATTVNRALLKEAVPPSAGSTQPSDVERIEIALKQIAITVDTATQKLARVVAGKDRREKKRAAARSPGKAKK